MCQKGFRAENVLPFVEASPGPDNPVPEGSGFKASQGDLAAKDGEALGSRDKNFTHREGKALRMLHILVGKPAYFAEVGGEPNLGESSKKFVEHNLSRIKAFSDKINIIKKSKRGDPKILIMPVKAL